MCNSGRIGNRPCLPAPVVGAPLSPRVRCRGAASCAREAGEAVPVSGRIGNRFPDSGRIGSPCPPIFIFRQNRQCPSLAPCPSVRFVPSVVKSPLSAESATPIRQFSISGRIGNRLLHSGRIGNRLPGKNRHRFSDSGRIGNHHLLHSAYSGRIGNRLPLPLPALASHIRRGAACCARRR